MVRRPSNTRGTVGFGTVYTSISGIRWDYAHIDKFEVCFGQFTVHGLDTWLCE